MPSKALSRASLASSEEVEQYNVRGKAVIKAKPMHQLMTASTEHWRNRPRNHLKWDPSVQKHLDGSRENLHHQANQNPSFRVVEWRRKPVVNYTRCRTNKGDFAKWLQVLDTGREGVSCRYCGKYEESGFHVALVCMEGESLGRRFGNWEEVDDPARVRRKVMIEGKAQVVDLAESFFGRLRGC
ncbi:hypothetical protein EV426DRAFT_718542 [Tirmania nivea]|nr:hypothetical protein EV426DRAFT_718542 [Tirmania nivea]